MPLKQKLIIDDDLGLIKLTKYKRARNLRLIVKKNSQIKISLPYFVSYDDALQFLYSKKSWVQEQLKHNQQKLLTQEQKLIQELTQVISNHALLVLAQDYVPSRLEKLAWHFNLKYSRLTLRNTRTRWGSCSSANNINISIQVMNLTPELIDYVLLHELTHTIHKNHSSRFWEALSLLLGRDAKQVDKALKSYKLY